MNAPIVLAADVLSEASPITIGFAVVIVGLGVAWGETRVHVSGLREWKSKAEQQIEALQTENADIKGRANIQGQQIAHIIEMLTELRTDVKRLLER